MCQDSIDSLYRPVVHRDHMWHIETPEHDNVERHSYVCYAPRRVRSKSQFLGHLHLLQTWATYQNEGGSWCFSQRESTFYFTRERSLWP